MIDISAADLLPTLLARPPMYNGLRLNSRRNWSDMERQEISILCGGVVPIEKAADILGRSPTSIARQSRDLGLRLPEDWRKLLSPKRAAVPQRIPLSYPYIIKERPSDADLLRVNSLVPKTFPEHMRADICQSVMLALYEGDISLPELESNKTNMRWFVKRYYREQSPYQEIHIDLSDRGDDRPYYDIAASAWHEAKESALNDARSAWDAQSSFSEADQIDHIYQKEVTRIHRGVVARGELLSRSEVQSDIDADRLRVFDFLRPA